MPERIPPDIDSGCALFLDVDGTLLELAEDRQAMVFDARLKDLILRLADRLQGALALVSGRGLADLDRMSGGLKVALAAEHGAWLREAGGRCRMAVATDPHNWRAVVDGLYEEVARHPGLELEEKGLSAALHYRSRPRLAGAAESIARRAAARLQADCRLRNGKMVVEIAPHDAHKGGAIAAFLKQLPFAGRQPVFAGDDVTDEDGFVVVNNLGGISIKVGEGGSAARYRIGSVRAFRGWLERQAGRRYNSLEA